MGNESIKVILLEAPARVTIDDEVSVMSGQRGILLRLLLLWPNQHVPNQVLEKALAVRSRSLATYLSHLRVDLASRVEIHRPGGITWIDRKNISVDALEVEQFHAQMLLAESLGQSPSLADVTAAIQRIAHTPAAGFDELVRSWTERDPDDSDARVLEQIWDRWQDIIVDLSLVQARLLLEDGSRHSLKNAITTLSARLHRGDTRDDVWPILFQVCEQLNDQHRLRGYWDQCVREYGSLELMPPDLRKFAPTDISPVTHQTRPAESESPLSQDDLALLNLADSLGITSASALSLRDSHLSPLDCIQRTTSRLYFSGVLASKWVLEPAVRAEFIDLLEKLEDSDVAPDGEVKFLVLNPYGEAYERLRELRGGNISDESVPHLVKLARKYQSFEVRVFDQLPSFRIIVIDDDVVSFSPYALEKEAYRASDRGWEAPHVILDPRAAWPLAAAFERTFRETWNSSPKLEDVIVKRD